MRIVVLEGYTLNPGDLSWEKLRVLGPCEIHDRTAAEEVVGKSREAEIVLTNKTPLTAEMMAQLPMLKYIGVLATGYDIVDIKAAASRSIPVTNVPAYSTESVAQLAFAHLLNLCHHVAQHSESVRQGGWSRSEDFCFWEFPLIELSGLTLGIIGLGRIGRAVARIGLAFGMKVMAHDPMLSKPPSNEVVLSDLEAVFRSSDVVTLHCPLTADNRGFVDADLLALMKSHAFFINTSRGPLVDEAALADALNHEKIAGACLDVLAQEPPNPASPLLTAKNCYITPHIAWATRAARQRLMDVAVENIAAFLRGEKLNVVNGV
ncbi:D-2-hydroxyacid dehydrogenase [candidate division KSB1 bacterium]|nr:D-2-hydroxyacid dehydrogenase [candidate division KSB1 bacterium]